MRDLITDGRLIPFSDDEKQLVNNTVDFFGLNYYTAMYTMWVGTEKSDTGTQASLTNKTGHVIGPMADSNWLFVYP
jgi:beta-glucosidase/6-phospho-beta-glucosidase/beta-galactosidase